MGLFPGKCTSNARLDGKTAIITGCNTGIGKCTASDLYKRGCRVIMACRDIEKTKNAKDDIETNLKQISGCGSLIIKKLDLSSFKSIRAFAEEILQEEQKIHLLINNAGVAFINPKSYTEDGFELHFGTNHLGHFLLTILLLPRIIQSGQARIINIASIMHKIGHMDCADINLEKSYNPFLAYSRSKLANMLFTAELAKRLEGKNVNVYAVHPGFVRTDLDRHASSVTFPGIYYIWHYFLSFIMKTSEDGAQTTIHCAVDEKVKNETGLYYVDCKVDYAHPKALDMKAAKELWDVSWKLVGLKDYDCFQ